MLQFKTGSNFLTIKRGYCKITSLVLLFLAYSVCAFSQAAPNISYPQQNYVYGINAPITPLVPTNHGGVVPATIYGTVSTFAGGRAPVTFDATGTGAGFNFPSGITSDAAGIIYVSDYGSGAIRKITTAAVVTTIATNTNSPSGIVIDNQGNIFGTNFQTNNIFKLSTNGTVSILAGNGTAASIDGTGASASFNNPGGIAIDPSGNLYVADQQGNKIRIMTPAGVVTTLAGSGAVGANNGTSMLASFNNPDGLAIDKQGNVFVVDTKNNLIRKITPAGIVSTFAGSGLPGSTDATGAAASFNYPTSITFDASGNLFVADFKNDLIRMITPAGVVTTIAGTGSGGSANGLGTAASFNSPLGLKIDVSGNLYITDAGNYLIREVILTGYTIDKALPPGLVFDPLSGTISGTPTAPSPATNYSITAYNGTGSSTTIVNIQVTAAPLIPSVITFTPPSPSSINANNNIVPGASSTNNQTPITYTSSNILVATITAGGLIHLVGPGVTIITAAQSGNAIYSAAVPVPITFTVQQNQNITLPVIPAKTICDADFSANATSNNATIPIIYSSSNLAVATISAQGLIHITGAGTTTITANQAGNALYTPASPQSQVLTVTAPVVPLVAITPDVTTICEGTPVIYTAVVSNLNTNLTYQWKVNGINAGTNSPTLTQIILTSADIVQCLVTNNGVCPAVGSSNIISGIIVNPYYTPAVSIVTTATVPVCSGSVITFTATAVNSGGNAPSYKWQVNNVDAGVTGPLFTTTTLANGDVVSCILTSSGGACLTSTTAVSNNIQISIITTGNAGQSVTITASTNGVYSGTPIQFTATPLNAGNNPDFQWQVNGVDVGTNSPFFTSRTLNNGDLVTCSLINAGGCIPPVTSLPIIVNLLTPPTVNIPNAFTPNGDGINDLWDIPNLAYYPNCIMRVYSRYGSLVYQSNGYAKPWDGSSNGKPLPTSTYYYIVDLGDKSPKLSGYITIIH